MTLMDMGNFNTGTGLANQNFNVGVPPMSIPIVP